MRLIQLSSSDPPVSLADAKAHLRIDGNELDAALSPLIPAALGWVEAETRLSITPASFRLYLDGFPQDRTITLPRPPLCEVQAVRFIYTGIEQELDPATYTPDPSGSKPGRIVLNAGASWPPADDTPGSVRVEFTAGYGASIPPVLKVAVLMMAGHFLESPQAAIDRRVDVVPLGVESIVNQFMFPEAV